MELYGSLWNLQHLCVYYATYEIWPFLWPKSGFADADDQQVFAGSQRSQTFVIFLVADHTDNTLVPSAEIHIFEKGCKLTVKLTSGVVCFITR
jgi:hypothetical protein